MKKSLILCAALLACALGFQSCDKVDNPGSPTEAVIENGSDLKDAIAQFAKEGVVTLPAGVELTLNEEIELTEPLAIIGDKEKPAKIVAKAGIVTTNNLSINNVKFEVADGFKDALIKMNTLPTEGLNDKGAFEIEAITFDGVSVNNLQAQFFWTNTQTYYIKNFVFNNGTINMKGAAKKTIFDWKQGGFVSNFTLTNSTLSADETTTWQKGGFFSSQSAKKPTEVSSEEGIKQIFTITNNTLNSICKGQTSFNLRENNKDYQFYIVKDNKVTDCDKENQFIVGLAGGTLSKKDNWTASGNIVFWGGNNVGAKENEKSGLDACLVPDTPEAE